jgi:hypothetical protein
VVEAVTKGDIIALVVGAGFLVLITLANRAWNNDRKKEEEEG